MISSKLNGSSYNNFQISSIVTLISVLLERSSSFCFGFVNRGFDTFNLWRSRLSRIWAPRLSDCEVSEPLVSLATRGIAPTFHRALLALSIIELHRIALTEAKPFHTDSFAAHLLIRPRFFSLTGLKNSLYGQVKEGQETNYEVSQGT